MQEASSSLKQSKEGGKPQRIQDFTWHPGKQPAPQSQSIRQSSAIFPMIEISKQESLHRLLFAIFLPTNAYTCAHQEP